MSLNLLIFVCFVINISEMYSSNKRMENLYMNSPWKTYLCILCYIPWKETYIEEQREDVFYMYEKKMACQESIILTESSHIVYYFTKYMYEF